MLLLGDHADLRRGDGEFGLMVVGFRLFVTFGAFGAGCSSSEDVGNVLVVILVNG